jgi:hypothetical protein
MSATEEIKKLEEQIVFLKAEALKELLNKRATILESLASIDAEIASYGGQKPKQTRTRRPKVDMTQAAIKLKGFLKAGELYTTKELAKVMEIGIPAFRQWSKTADHGMLHQGDKASFRWYIA